MVTEEMISNWLAIAFKDADIKVTGDGRHFHATVISSDFAGMSRLARHRSTYAALGDKVGGLIHALSLTTLTPDEKK